MSKSLRSAIKLNVKRPKKQSPKNVTTAGEVTFAKEKDVNLPGGSGHQLRDHWVKGEGAAKIRWKTPGDFTRCVAQLGKYVNDPKGLCAEYHKAATGMWPGDKRNPGMDSDTVAQDDTVLYASGQEANDDMTDIKPTGPSAWRGVLTVEGIESGDGRMFAPNSLTWADLPLPLRWQKESAHGGQNDVTVQVGNIDKIWREPASDGGPTFLIMGEGTIDLANPDGREVYRRMKNKYMRGNSVDVDSVKGSDIEYTYPQSVESPVATDGETESAGASFLDMMAQPELTTYKKGRIRATTLVEIPAFTEAKLALVNIDPVVTADADTEATVESQNEEVETPVTDSVMETIVAATSVIEIADAPPREWFSEPTDVTALGALTVTAEGRVYGYIAPAGVRHRSFRDRVVNVPLKKVDYSRFMGGETIVADGGRVSTGSITMGCGHASTTTNLNGQQAAEHYDNSCSIVATVRVGENEHGVWMAGALLPDIDSAQLRRIMACRLSGDWRGHLDKPGWREFVAALLVPVPGFPMARTAPSVSMAEGQLVASSVPVQLIAADMLFKPKSKKDDDDEENTDKAEKSTDDAEDDEDAADDDKDKNKKRVGAAALRVRALRAKSLRAQFSSATDLRNDRVTALRDRVAMHGNHDQSSHGRKGLNRGKIGDMTSDKSSDADGTGSEKPKSVRRPRGYIPLNNTNTLKRAMKEVSDGNVFAWGLSKDGSYEVRLRRSGKDVIPEIRDGRGDTWGPVEDGEPINIRDIDAEVDYVMVGGGMGDAIGADDSTTDYGPSEEDAKNASRTSNDLDEAMKRARERAAAQNTD